jgi:acetylglutamate kinase
MTGSIRWLDALKVAREAAATLSFKRMKEVDAANGVITYDESYITPSSSEDLAKLTEEERIKNSQSQKSESLHNLLKSFSTIKNSLHLNELLLRYLQKSNNIE